MSPINTQTVHIKSIITHNIAMHYPEKTLAGFKHGSSLPEADTMSTARAKISYSLNLALHMYNISVERLVHEFFGRQSAQV
jgi:hypothetical protein